MNSKYKIELTGTQGVDLGGRKCGLAADNRLKSYNLIPKFTFERVKPCHSRAAGIAWSDCVSDCNKFERFICSDTSVAISDSTAVRYKSVLIA